MFYLNHAPWKIGISCQGSHSVALILVLFVLVSSGVTPPSLWIGLDDSRFSCASLETEFLSFPYAWLQCIQSTNETLRFKNHAAWLNPFFLITLFISHQNNLLIFEPREIFVKIWNLCIFATFRNAVVQKKEKDFERLVFPIFKNSPIGQKSFMAYMLHLFMHNFMYWISKVKFS